MENKAQYYMPLLVIFHITKSTGFIVPQQDIKPPVPPPSAQYPIPLLDEYAYWLRHCDNIVTSMLFLNI